MRNKKGHCPLKMAVSFFCKSTVKQLSSYPVQSCVENADCGYPPDKAIILCA